MRTKLATAPLPLPPAFLERMQRMLAGEFAEFLNSYAQPAWNGLRANTLKISPQRLAELLPYSLEPVPWCEAGFLLSPSPAQSALPAPGKHPYHAAGVYYLQDPSAMAVVDVLDPQPGERILDLAAAPGGKSTHIAARLQQQGLLVANEIHPGRVWELAQNLERWGAHNVIVCNETPERLAGHFEGYFDRVLLDAPCSGEGLFRKLPASRTEWSPAVVQSCALRQIAILEQAARLVRPGGWLGYSTCTFSPEENEAVIAAFLHQQTGFQLAQVGARDGLSPGNPDWGGVSAILNAAGLRRIWPHLSPGEGHFIALLQREPQKAPGVRMGRFPRWLPSAAGSAWQQFVHHNLVSDLDMSSVTQLGSYLYALPEQAPDFGNLRLIHPGWWLGKLVTSARSKEQRLEPAHALALGLEPTHFQRSLPLGIAQAERYLQGELLESQPGEDGWLVVELDGFALGWGKIISGRVKNHYPRGLRLPRS